MAEFPAIDTSPLIFLTKADLLDLLLLFDSKIIVLIVMKYIAQVLVLAFSRTCNIVSATSKES